MSIVVSQRLPWSQEELELDRTQRWQKLAPLVRRATKASDAFLVDTNQASKKQVQVIVVGDAVHVAEAFLGSNGVTACVLDSTGEITSSEIIQLSKHKGLDLENGSLIIRVGGERRLEVMDEGAGVSAPGGVMEVFLEDEVERAHLVALLADIHKTARESMQSVAELLKHFIKTAKSTITSIHEQKMGERIAIVHAGHHEEFETAHQAIEKDLTKLLKEIARAVHGGMEMTYSVHFADVNGLSILECWLLGFEISQHLDSQSVPHHLTTSSSVMRDLESRGYVLSVCPVIRAILPPTPKPANELSNPSVATANSSTGPPSSKPFPFTDEDIRHSLRSGCQALIDAEARITEYDTIVGDGDCGLTLRDGAQKVLSFIEGKDLGHLPSILSQLVDELEVTMGGTSGALYCIFLSSLSQTLSVIQTAADFPSALHASLKHLMRFTSARVGDRTMLDALIPFVETLQNTGGDVSKALDEARKGVESTKSLEAKLGRSAYLDEKATKGVPDPGAVGVFVLLEGLCGGQS